MVYGRNSEDSATCTSRFLLPDLLKAEVSHPNEVPGLFQHIKRNRMAKAGIEGAIWDLYAKREQKSLATLLGGTRTEIEVGVVIGINTIPFMLKQIESMRKKATSVLK